MPRDYRLVKANGEWQVCSKARRLDARGREYVCWIYGKERIEFCSAGKAEAVVELPRDTTNFFGDQFNFTILQRHISVDHWERIAGARNIKAANAAYEILLTIMADGMMLRLRQGSQIIREDRHQKPIANNEHTT